MFVNPHGPMNRINEGFTIYRFPEERRCSKLPSPFPGLCIVKGGNSDDRYANSL